LNLDQTPQKLLKIIFFLQKSLHRILLIILAYEVSISTDISSNIL